VGYLGDVDVFNLERCAFFDDEEEDEEGALEEEPLTSMFKFIEPLTNI
jgi:hypothetical protein